MISDVIQEDLTRSVVVHTSFSESMECVQRGTSGMVFTALTVNISVLETCNANPGD